MRSKHIIDTVDWLRRFAKRAALFMLCLPTGSGDAAGYGGNSCPPQNGRAWTVAGSGMPLGRRRGTRCLDRYGQRSLRDKSGAVTYGRASAGAVPGDWLAQTSAGADGVTARMASGRPGPESATMTLSIRR